MALPPIPIPMDTIRKNLDNIADGVQRTINSTRKPKGSTEPQRAYLWEVHIEDESGNDAWYYAKATAIPTTVNETVKRYHMGVEYAFPTRDVSPRIFRVTFWDNEDMNLYNYFQNWIDSLNDFDTSPDNYSKNIRLKMMDAKGTLPKSEILMEECFPTEISEVSLTYMESSEVTFDVLFYYHTKKMITDVRGFKPPKIDPLGSLMERFNGKR